MSNQVLEPEWARRIGNYTYALKSLKNMATDRANNIYVTCTYSGLLKIYANDHLTNIIDVSNAGSGDTFIVKYNSSGIVQWARHIGGTSSDNGYGIATDNNNDVYITGSYSSSTITAYATTSNDKTGAIDVSNSGTGNDAFIVKYNSLGEPQWARHIGNTSQDYGYGIAVDSLNNIYVTGHYHLTARVYTGTTNDPTGAINLSNESLVSITSDVFIVKYNSSGTAQWARHIGGIVFEYGYGIAIDTLNNIYLTGNYNSSTLTVYALETNITTNAITLSYTAFGDAFIVKYNSLGEPQWARHISGATSSEIGYGITTDTNNNVYVTGEYTSTDLKIYTGTTNDTIGAINLSNAGTSSTDAFIVKYNSSGDPQWARHIGGSSSDSGYSLVSDSLNNIYVVCEYYSTDLKVYTSTSNDTTNAIDVSNTGNSDTCIVKYNSNGTPIFARTIYGSSWDSGFGITIDSSDNIYVCGTYSSEPLNIYTTEFIANMPKSTAIVNMFIVKYNTTIKNYTGFINLLPSTGTTTLSSYFDTIKSYAVSSTVKQNVKQYIKNNKSKLTSLVTEISGSILTNFITQKAVSYDETLTPKLAIVADSQIVDLAPHKTALLNNEKELYLYGASGEQVTLQLDSTNYTITLRDNGAVYNNTHYGLGQSIPLGSYNYTITALGSVIGSLTVVNNTPPPSNGTASPTTPKYDLSYNPVEIIIPVTIDSSGGVVELFGSEAAPVQYLLRLMTDVSATTLYDQTDGSGVLEYIEASGDLVGPTTDDQRRDALDVRFNNLTSKGRELATSFATALHYSLTHSIDASAVYAAYTSADQTYESFGDFVVSFIAQQVFGHPRATAAISNDTSIITRLNATYPISDTLWVSGLNNSTASGSIVIRLIQALRNLSDEDELDATTTTRYNLQGRDALRSIVTQMMLQDPARFSVERSELQWLGLEFRPDDKLVFNIKLKGFSFNIEGKTGQGGVYADSYAPEIQPTEFSIIFKLC